MTNLWALRQRAIDVHGLQTIEGTTAHFGAHVVELVSTDSVAGEIHLDEGRRLTFDGPLAATGKVPNTRGLPRELAGLETTEHGAHSGGLIIAHEQQDSLGGRGAAVGMAPVDARAGETLGELSVAVAAWLTTTTLAGATHAYPTFSDTLWDTAIADVPYWLKHGVAGFVLRMLARLRRATRQRNQRQSC